MQDRVDQQMRRNNRNVSEKLHFFHHTAFLTRKVWKKGESA